MKWNNKDFWKGVLATLIIVFCVFVAWKIYMTRNQSMDTPLVSAVPTRIIIEVDNQTIVLENLSEKPLSELLVEAGVTIGEGDIVSFDTNQTFSGDVLNIQIVRKTDLSLRLDIDEHRIILENIEGKTLLEYLKENGIVFDENDILMLDMDQILSESNPIIRVLHKENTPLVLNVEEQQIILKDVEDKTLSELLSENGLTIGEGDILTFESDQALSGDLLVRILSRSNVTILVTDDESGDEIQYHIVMNGGTVEDALRAAGLTLGENQEINVDLSAPLQDGMEILIAEKEEESYYSNYWESDDNSTTTTTTTTSQESSTTATESSTSAEESSEEITIVSIEVYEDTASHCFFTIITYSDGSQEVISDEGE